MIMIMIIFMTMILGNPRCRQGPRHQGHVTVGGSWCITGHHTLTLTLSFVANMVRSAGIKPYSNACDAGES